MIGRNHGHKLFSTYLQIMFKVPSKKNTFILPLLGVTLDTMLIGKDSIVDIAPVGFK